MARTGCGSLLAEAQVALFRSQREGARKDPVVTSLSAQVAVLLRAVLQQHRLCAVWSRTPASTHNGGADFPLDMGAAAGAAPAWAAAATHRLALKRRVDGEAAAVSYHALLTQPGGTAKAHGGPQPEFFDVQLTARGVTMARA